MELPKFTANCAKSAQFAHCHRKSHKIRAICVNFPRFSVPTSKIAKISSNSCFGQISQISPAIFRFAPRKMELPKFTANCTKSAQFAHCHCKSCKIHAICTNFLRFSVPTGKIVKISDNSHFLANYTKFANHFLIQTMGNRILKINSKLCKICSICPPSLQIT